MRTAVVCFRAFFEVLTDSEVVIVWWLQDTNIVWILTSNHGATFGKHTILSKCTVCLALEVISERVLVKLTHS